MAKSKRGLSKKQRKQRKEQKRLQRHQQKVIQNNKIKSPYNNQYPLDVASLYPNAGQIIYDNVVENFISRISQPTVENFTPFRGKKVVKRQENAVYESSRAKATLSNLVIGISERDGSDAVAWRLEENSQRVNELTNYIMFGSEASIIASACSELAEIINGGHLPLDILSDLAEQEEYNESWGDELYE